MFAYDVCKDIISSSNYVRPIQFFFFVKTLIILYTYQCNNYVCMDWVNINFGAVIASVLYVHELDYKICKLRYTTHPNIDVTNYLHNCNKSLYSIRIKQPNFICWMISLHSVNIRYSDCFGFHSKCLVYINFWYFLDDEILCLIYVNRGLMTLTNLYNMFCTKK